LLKHSFLSYLGKKFSFRGCGWSKRTFCWSQEDEVWIDVKQPEAESNDLDGVAPLQSQPLPCVSNSDELKTADVPVLHCSDAVVEASSLPGTETRHSSNDVEEVARSEVCSPVAPLPLRNKFPVVWEFLGIPRNS